MASLPYNSCEVKPKINIDYVCALAHLRLSDKEKSRLAPQLIKIVQWVDKLEELHIDISKGEMFSPVPFPLPLRKDEILASFSSDVALANSPEKKGNFIKVPQVIKEK